MRVSFVALCVPAFALALQSCGPDEVVEVTENLPIYNCPGRCQEMATTIAQVGRNPETLGVGEMDPNTVCQHEAITGAITCSACDAAIADTYRLLSTSIACDCPNTSRAADDPENIRIIYVDGQCEQVNEPFSVAACGGFRGNRHPNPGSCTMPSPFSFAGGVVAIDPAVDPSAGDIVGPLH